LEISRVYKTKKRNKPTNKKNTIHQNGKPKLAKEKVNFKIKTKKKKNKEKIFLNIRSLKNQRKKPTFKKTNHWTHRQ